MVAGGEVGSLEDESGKWGCEVEGADETFVELDEADRCLSEVQCESELRGLSPEDERLLSTADCAPGQVPDECCFKKVVSKLGSGILMKRACR